MPTALVVDDSALDRRLAGQCVEENGLTAVYAENGRIAWEALELIQPDFVLTDLQMPEMDGLELVRKICRHHPRVPVILMTGNGSEEIAVNALKLGATSYVPKQNLRTRLGEALDVVRDAVAAMRSRDSVRELLQASESRFLLGYEPTVARALISHLQDSLARLNFCDQVGLLQISTALGEAITNAIDHGNLELDSAMRDGSCRYRDLGKQRSMVEPYCNRRVSVTARLTPERALYVVEDEGPGFDPTSLPDPTHPSNLLKSSGRGIMLIRTFMHEVQFNERGNRLTMIRRRNEAEAT
ncbi:MAG TPA: response regulator [Pirellulaceae bacterium]|jgi:CheY-like chemotaxis protein|nr:response regulator [Pirellulaceae bacterium]